MSDCEILSGAALSERIRGICSQDSVDCAVAFLSGAVRDDLFPRWKNQTVRIVCDISMGCNSQFALKAFGAPKNVNLRVRDGLHSKIYVSDFGAIVSSANASLNGVGLTNRPAGNFEVGVFLHPNTTGWLDAKKLFEQLWNSPVIDAKELDRAPKLTSDPGKRISQEGRRDRSLLKQLKSYPQQFSSVLFVAEHRPIKRKEASKAARHYEAAEQEGEFQTNRRDLILRARHAEFPPIPRNAIMFWHDGEGSKVDILAYSDVVAVRSKKFTTLWGIKHWPEFWRALETKAPRKALSDAEEDFIRSLHDGSWVVCADELASSVTEHEIGS